MKRIFALMLTLGLFAGVAYAHNGMVHVMGTVTAMSDTSISVKATDGTSQTVSVTSETKYSKVDKVVTMKEIKVGDHVVIHATKKDNQLVAAEIKVGAMKMKGMSGDMSGMKMDGKSPTAPPK